MKNKSTNLTPEYIVEIILRRRWYLIIPFCLTMLAGIFYAVWAPKIYEASTLILIEPQRVSENYVQSIVAVDPEYQNHHYFRAGKQPDQFRANNP